MSTQHHQISQIAKQVLALESQAIAELIQTIDLQFCQAVEYILHTQGRVILTGMGKPGYIAHKIAATLMSTGTPAFYLHPAEGAHGDLGMVTPTDLVIAISNSGETQEVINLLPTLSRLGVPIIAIGGNGQSTLARHATLYLNAHVTQEACPLGLAPTTSTTAELALGDALAVAVMSLRQFSPENFAIFHPGGSLGKQLLTTIEHVMAKGHHNPIVKKDKSVTDALFIMTEKGFGAVSVIDDRGKLLGIITDGDIRRALKKGPQLLNQPVTALMNDQPVSIKQGALLSQALHLMENHHPKPITVIPVIDDEGHVTGLLHLTQLLKNRII